MLGGCILLVLAAVTFLVLGAIYLFGDPCLPFCASSDTGAWGTVATMVFVAAAVAHVVLIVRLVRGRNRDGIVASTLGLALLVAALGVPAMIGADVANAEPRF